TRLSTPRLVSSPADRVLSTEAATPAGWSPGSACCGTVIVSGTTTLSPASTVTSGAMSIQVPASVDSSPEASMSNRPVAVVNPSAAERRNVSCLSPRLWTAMCSVRLSPGSSACCREERPSRPDSSAGVTAQRVAGSGSPSASAAGVPATPPSPSRIAATRAARRARPRGGVTWIGASRGCTALPSATAMLRAARRPSGAGQRPDGRLSASALRQHDLRTASVRFLEQRQRERGAVRAGRHAERGLQRESGRGRPPAARPARLRGVERARQQLLPLAADVVRDAGGRALVEGGRHLLAGGNLPVALGDQARRPAEMVGGDRLLALGARELARLPGDVPVDALGDVRPRVSDGHLGQLAHELAVLGRGVLHLGERLGVARDAEGERAGGLLLLDRDVEVDAAVAHPIGDGRTSDAEEEQAPCGAHDRAQTRDSIVPDHSALHSSPTSGSPHGDAATSRRRAGAPCIRSAGVDSERQRIPVEYIPGMSSMTPGSTLALRSAPPSAMFIGNPSPECYREQGGT